MRITTFICTRCARSETFFPKDKMSHWLSLSLGTGTEKTPVYLCEKCKYEWEEMTDKFLKEYSNGSGSETVH